MLQSVFYNIVIAILLVTVVGSTHLHVVCHHLSTDGSLKGLAISQGLHDCPLPLSEGLDRPLLSVLCCCFLARSLVKILP